MKAVFVGALAVCATASQEGSTANPIRKVVTMLQNIQKKVEAEAAKEEAMFKKFLCYCSTSGGALKESIDGSTAKVPEVQSDIEAGEAQVKQLGADLKKHADDRAAAKAAMAEADAIREKEAAEYAALKTEASTQIAAITKAVAALEKGAGGAFLQSPAAGVLRSLVQSEKLNNLEGADRDQVTSFLAASQESEYAPASGEITGILKQMGDEMSANLASATKDEESSIKAHAALIAAKKKEVAANTEAIETKTVRVGELKVKIVEMKQDLSDTEAALIADQKFLADLEKNCATAQEDWDKTCKTRAEEVLALADTIKLLNSDDALELFKKALPAPGASFLQVQVAAKSARVQALEMLRSTSTSRPQMDMIFLALQGKKVSFDKVLKMIDDMVALLKQEQVDDDSKKEYCNLQFDSLDDSRKGLERAISDSEVAIDDATEMVKTLTGEIEALAAGIKALDKSVAEATEQRKDENAEFTELMAQDRAAKELLGVAKNRLNKFYNPKLVEPELVSVNVHGSAAAAPPPAPELPGAHKKKTEESNGVIAMIDGIIADLDKEMTVAQAEEKDAQGDYEKMMSDSATKRADDSKAISDKEGTKADTEASLMKHQENLKSQKKEMMATLEVISALHSECDWLLQYFDVRKEARTNEIAALVKAKAVLNGASYSLIETKRLRGRQ